MLIKLFAVLSVLIETVLVYCTDWVNGWKDFWIPIVLFLGLFFGMIIAYILMIFIISLFLSVIKPKENKPSRVCKFFIDYTAQAVLTFLRGSYVVTGMEKIPTNRRFLLVCNHRSGLDPFASVPAFRKYNISYISKPENFKIPMVDPFLSHTCYMTIDRENARNAMKTLHRATDLVKNDVVSIGIYPEGTRSRTGKLLEFKDGVFYIAKKSPCPIVVVTVQNAENVFKRFPFKRTVVKLDVLSCIEPESFEKKSTHEISEEVRNMMLEHLGE